MPLRRCGRAGPRSPTPPSPTAATRNPSPPKQALDGLYIVRTNAEPALLSTEQTIRAYKSLSTVEWAFRSMKAVDLRVRPIFHRKPERVRAHIFLCLLAYYGEWHLRKALAPLF